MSRDIKYCQICHHRQHTKMDGIACKKGIREFDGRCEAYMEDDVARQTLLQNEIKERDRLEKVIFTIWSVLFILSVALWCGAYFGDYKFDQVFLYLICAIAIGLSFFAGAHGIMKVFELCDSRKRECPLTLDAVAEYIYVIGFIPYVVENEVRFKIDDLLYVLSENGEDRIIFKIWHFNLDTGLLERAKRAAYEVMTEKYMVKPIIYRFYDGGNQSCNSLELQLHLQRMSEKDFRRHFDTYIKYLTEAYESICDKCFAD